MRLWVNAAWEGLWHVYDIYWKRHTILCVEGRLVESWVRSRLHGISIDMVHMHCMLVVSSDMDSTWWITRMLSWYSASTHIAMMHVSLMVDADLLHGNLIQVIVSMVYRWWRCMDKDWQGEKRSMSSKNMKTIQVMQCSLVIRNKLIISISVFNKLH